MNVMVNGESLRVAATTLAALLTELGYTATNVATAVDGEFVPLIARDDQPLCEGMSIDIVAPIQGG